MLEILSTYGGPLAGVAGAIALIVAQIRTNSIKSSTALAWKEEAEVQKTRADRLITELEGVKHELEDLKKYTLTLVAVLSAIDPQKLEELRITRGR